MFSNTVSLYLLTKSIDILETCARQAEGTSLLNSPLDSLKNQGGPTYCVGLITWSH
jgi:hypothetical protein